MDLLDDMPILFLIFFLAGFIAFLRLAVSAYRRFKLIVIRKRIRDVIFELAKLYALENPHKLSVEYRKEQKIKSDEYIFGEIMFASFAEILSLVKPQPQEVFYDLGCGSGKAIFLTALIYKDIVAHGVEILPPMYELDIKLLKNLKTQAKDHPTFKTYPLNINFHNADIFEFDFTDADIVFINATCYSKKRWEEVENIFKKLKKGTRIILTSKTLKEADFKLIHARYYLMSWGISVVRIYLKR